MNTTNNLSIGSTHTRLLLALIIAATTVHLLAGSARAAAISLEALQRDGYGVVDIQRPQPNTLTIVAEVNGRKLRLMVDTGWGSDGIAVDSTLFSPGTIATEAVGDFGRSATGKTLDGMKRGQADRVVIGNVEMKNVPLYLGRIDALRTERMRRASGVDGFLSAGFLRTCSAVIDLQNLKVYLRPPGTGRRAVLGPALQGAGLAEASFELAGNSPLVDVEINALRGKMIVDTGAFVAGVDSRLTSQMKVAAYNSRAGTIDAAGVRTTSQFANLNSFKIGGLPVRAPDVRMSKFGFYASSGGKVIGLLGMDILGTNGTIIDFGARRLYFYPLR